MQTKCIHIYALICVIFFPDEAFKSVWNHAKDTSTCRCSWHTHLIITVILITQINKNSELELGGNGVRFWIDLLSRSVDCTYRCGGSTEWIAFPVSHLHHWIHLHISEHVSVPQAHSRILITPIEWLIHQVTQQDYYGLQYGTIIIIPYHNSGSIAALK